MSYICPSSVSKSSDPSNLGKSTVAPAVERHTYRRSTRAISKMMQSTTRAFRSLSLSSNRLTSPTHHLMVREKHSKRQIKRIFTQHPQRIRIMKRVNGDKEPPALPEPKYPPILDNVTHLPNGYTPPPPTELEIPKYPFIVRRTENKPMNAPGFLPVYAKFRKDGTKAVTHIRRVEGDVNGLVQELSAVLELPISKIKVRSGKTIQVDGHYVRPIKTWLASLGF